MLRLATFATPGAVIAVLMVSPAPSFAVTNLSMQEAVKRCIARTQRFANETVGPDDRVRTEFEIRAAYQRCVWGFTGEVPALIPPFPRS